MVGRSLLFLAALAVVALVLADEFNEPPSQLADLLGAAADARFEKALTPRSFVFPRDHGPHPSFRNEWWYVTGNLDDDDGRRFGFELTFFRFALAPLATESSSAWRTNQVYMAHLAMTDAENENFFVAQRYSRAALGLGGATAEPFRVWIDDWGIESVPQLSNVWKLRAANAEFGLDLELSALRPPVLNGVDGLSQKSVDPGNASYYYSITRLQTHGQVRIDERVFRASGLSWLDREWSTSALASEQVGWDWFALQLSDGSDLMFYQIRKQDGTLDAQSAGTWINTSGEVTHLSHDDVEIRVEDSWESPNGGRYPSRWHIRVPQFGLDATIMPVISDQELVTLVRYWEGAVDVAGTRESQKITGRGYVEMTGYAE